MTKLTPAELKLLRALLRNYQEEHRKISLIDCIDKTPEIERKIQGYFKRDLVYLFTIRLLDKLFNLENEYKR